MDKPVHDAKTRFSTRVADYVRYRPGYPAAVTEHLRDTIGLNAEWTIADVGAGTGISSKLFLDAGCEVIAVEPNAEMRAAATEWLQNSPRFHPIDGSAELTGLEKHSVHLIVCAQAFHWFDIAPARQEFQRILKPPGWVVLIWNDRDRNGSSFAEGYDSLLKQYGTDYQRVRHDRVPTERINEFFGGKMEEAGFPNQQQFDFEGLRGRLMSSSYAPLEGHVHHQPMMGKLRELYDQYQVDGRITFEYRTRVFRGRLS
ncbi:MAG TPA: class I SAM-dependent methyltransferase [Tepidisphaeraceae bacterium]|jgi:SAM-dependent methyltransferase|nr:class I SAM-dependent methyltransferase [Tepidisphaeraceae bacterium]